MTRWHACDLAPTALTADMNKRPQTMLKPLLVVNMDVKDNAEEASLAAPQALKLCSMVRRALFVRV